MNRATWIWSSSSLAGLANTPVLPSEVLEVKNPPAGSLKVATTNVLPGWLSRNGIPYGENLALTEYFIRFTNKDAGDWLVITTTYDDPQNLQRQWTTSTNFQREPNDSKWAPAPCKS